MGPRASLGLMDSIKLSGLAPNSQGVARPANEENWGGGSDATTNGMIGGWRTDSPTNRDKNGQGVDGVVGVRTGAPPHN